MSQADMLTPIRLAVEDGSESAYLHMLRQHHLAQAREAQLNGQGQAPNPELEQQIQQKLQKLKQTTGFGHSVKDSLKNSLMGTLINAPIAAAMSYPAFKGSMNLGKRVNPQTGHFENVPGWGKQLFSSAARNKAQSLSPSAELTRLQGYKNFATGMGSNLGWGTADGFINTFSTQYGKRDAKHWQALSDRLHQNPGMVDAPDEALLPYLDYDKNRSPIMNATRVAGRTLASNVAGGVLASAATGQATAPLQRRISTLQKQPYSFKQHMKTETAAPFVGHDGRFSLSHTALMAGLPTAIGGLSGYTQQKQLNEYDS